MMIQQNTVQVWNLELMNCAQTLARHEGSVTCLIASRGKIYSGAVDSTLKVGYINQYLPANSLMTFTGMAVIREQY